MGNNSSCASATEAPARTSSSAAAWKPRASGEGRRDLLCRLRRLTVAKMLHARLGDEAIWLEGELLEIIIRAIPIAGMCISVGGPAEGCECTTIAAALAAAQPGDTIKLLPGVYREPIVLQPSPSGVTLVGAGTRPSDVVVEWGDDSAESAGVQSVHNAGVVIGKGEMASYSLGSDPPSSPETSHELALHARATLAALQQEEADQQLNSKLQQLAKGLRYLQSSRNDNARVQWIKYCSPLRTHASGVTVKNLTLRSTGSSPAVFADAGGLLLEDVVVEGAAVLETHARLRRCNIQPGVPHGVGICLPIRHATILLESCVVKDCLLGLAITGPASRGPQPTVTKIRGCTGSAVIRQRDLVWQYDAAMGEYDAVVGERFCLNHVPAQSESMLDDTTLVYQGGCVFRNCGQLLSKPAPRGSPRLCPLVPMLYDSELSRLLYEIDQLRDARSAPEQDGASVAGPGDSPEGPRGQETPAPPRPERLPFAAELAEEDDAILEQNRRMTGRHRSNQGGDGTFAPGPGVPYPARARPPYPSYYD